jgi:Outer membrane protein beta-barrel domain
MRTRVASLLSILALAAPTAARAQMPLPHPSFGLVGALNVASLGGSDASGLDSKVSFSVGGFVRLPMSPMWSFQPELEYAGKGAKSSDNTGSGSIKLSYLEVPLLFRVAAPSTPAGQLFGEFGPALAFKVDCTVSASSGGVSASTSCANAGADAKSFDFGGLVGAGYEFPMGSHALSLGVRYNYGFTEVSSGSDVKNRNLQFVAGLRF